MQPIILKPYFREKIWGGDSLKTDFHFDIPSDQTGEAWVISGHQNGPSIVQSPEEFKGQTFQQVFRENPALFGLKEAKEFPLLVKILDAQSDLSVQVHPDDDYARIHENDLGKTECWYILSAQPGAKIVYGHHAQSAQEFRQMVNQGQWDDLLRYKEVKAGDFFDVPHGTIHAIGGGITILETQQSSDTTYRVYDYNRRDDQGQTRDLHIEDSIAVSQIPHHDPELKIRTQKKGQSTISHFLTNDYFSVYKWDVKDRLTMETPSDYTLMTVISGSGSIQVGDQDYLLNKGSALVLPKAINAVNLMGNLSLMVACPE